MMVGLLPAMLLSLGEEIRWRGFLILDLTPVPRFQPGLPHAILGYAAAPLALPLSGSSCFIEGED